MTSTIGYVIAAGNKYCTNITEGAKTNCCCNTRGHGKGSIHGGMLAHAHLIHTSMNSAEGVAPYPDDWEDFRQFIKDVVSVLVIHTN